MPRRSAAELAARAELEERLKVNKRLLKIANATDQLIPFTELTMPHPKDPSDSGLSRYSAQYFHKCIAHALEQVERGELLRLIICMPPRHGKSELSTRRLPAHFVGRDPYKSVMVGTYNQPFADDFGRSVRRVMQSDAYGQIFPNTTLLKGSEAADRLMTEQEGMLAFVGRGGSITGRGADLFIIDDPLKGRKEADSPLIRDELWKWYNDDVISRMMTDEGAVIIVQTRWHEDDLVGRLTDPENAHFIESEAAQWKIINLASIARMYGAPDDDPLGRKPGDVLWPERFSRPYLEDFRKRNPLGFSALHQQVPTVADGTYFTADMIRTYDRRELPTTLRIYAASDHALTEKQSNDATVLLIVGVDTDGQIWVLDAWWGRAKPDRVVNEMLRLMEQWKPLIWWAEKDHITKSIGPFLRKRMMEDRVYINMQELSSSGDKVQKASPIIGRMSMKMVLFEKHWRYIEQAKSELMKFNHGKHDDFVDAIANIGRGLDQIVGMAPHSKPKPEPKSGTMGWLKQESNRTRLADQRAERLGSM